MQTIENLLHEEDPIEMVLAEVRQQYPQLATLPVDALAVSKIKPAVGKR